MHLGFNHELWGYVVPDGPDYCHWGGRRFSELLIERLEIGPGDRVLEICCGRGGLLSLAPTASMLCGVDVSSEALVEAKRKGLEGLIQGEAHHLPFSDAAFTKLVAQDADAWLCPDKTTLMKELHRVTVLGGRFVYQSYAVSEEMPECIASKTRVLLQTCGYEYTDLPNSERIQGMFEEASFRVVSLECLHDMYTSDNAVMLKRFRNQKKKISSIFQPVMVETLGELLQWEEVLFRKGFWTGILVTAEKK